MITSFALPTGKNLEFVFATKRDDMLFRRWAKSARRGSIPRVVDALELATLSFRRWREECVKGRIANSFDEIQEFIQDNPHAEVAVLILAKAPWLRSGSLVGLCHCRRTWCNNIYIDFLTVHPRLVRSKSVRGVGTALLYVVTSLAAKLDAGVVWGEATQNSHKFYRRVFGIEDIRDLILLGKTEYMAFQSQVKEKQQASPSP
jgi:hypothetical protein